MARELKFNRLQKVPGATLIMGVLNVTPDSFSDGNKFLDPEVAFVHAASMIKNGADIIDIGGESTRPGSLPVPVDVELERVIPVIKSIRKKSDVVISIDTTKSEVAEKALESGADIINDISGLTFDEHIADTAARFSAPLIIMHIKGKPLNMQENVQYDDLIQEIIDFFKNRIDFALSCGVLNENIILDPGIGFGKTVGDNFLILRELGRFKEMGFPLMTGVSRKSFIGNVLDVDVENRLMGTAAAVTASIMNGADIVRVHDVAEMKQVALIADNIKGNS